MESELQIEIRAMCPICGGKRYRDNGHDGNMIYRACQDCGHSGKVMRLTQAELGELLRRGMVDSAAVEVRVVRVTVGGFRVSE